MQSSYKSKSKRTVILGKKAVQNINFRALFYIWAPKTFLFCLNVLSLKHTDMNQMVTQDHCHRQWLPPHFWYSGLFSWNVVDTCIVFIYDFRPTSFHLFYAWGWEPEWLLLFCPELSFSKSPIAPLWISLELFEQGLGMSCNFSGIIPSSQLPLYLYVVPWWSDKSQTKRASLLWWVQRYGLLRHTCSAQLNGEINIKLGSPAGEPKLCRRVF